MILKKVKIYNYRQLQKVELDLQNSLTVLAGPNNSGKTTLISVLKGMFRDKKLSFTYSDIPTNLSTSWVEKIIPVFQSIMVENDKNTGISEIIKKISVDDKLLPEYTIECFHAEIQVDYDPTGDDIQLFADYLMDLDESKHSFYFIYSYEPSIASFEKYLGECYDKMSSRFLDISNPDCKEKETKLSIGKIISILNNIYNDDSFKQDPSEKNKDIVPDISPKVIITSNVAEAVEHFQTSFPGILTLYLMNKEKYAEIGAKNLYSTYEKMEAYSFGRKYSPTDVLSDMSNDNPDALMKFLFLLNNIMVLYTKENYGMLISVCRKENKFFNSSLFQLKRHTDKKALRDKFEAVKIVYEREKCLIKDVIECLFEQSLISATVKNIYEESAEYQQVLNIEIAEIKNLANYLRTPYISTQHGVKGESHQSVVFVAADNYSTPNVRMYSFFELWSKNTFSLPEFEDLFYSYSKIIMEVEAKLRMKISDLTAETHNKNEANKKLLAEYSNQVLNTYRDNKLFEALLKDDFIAYLAKSTVGNAKNIFKISKIEGILTAYKLFYVGCSRARKNLVIVVDETKINKFENEFKAKLISIGFEIQGFPMQETATV